MSLKQCGILELVKKVTLHAFCHSSAASLCGSFARHFSAFSGLFQASQIRYGCGSHYIRYHAPVNCVPASSFEFRSLNGYIIPMPSETAGKFYLSRYDR